MDRIDRNAYKLLKKINNNENFIIDDKNINQLSYLDELGLIIGYPLLSEVSKDPNSTKYLRTSNKGITYIANVKNEDWRFYFPIILTTIISAFSLAVSIAALCIGH